MEDEDDKANRIVTFADSIGGDRSARDKAIDRGWLTPSGEVTKEGHALVAWLEEQVGEPSVFRIVQ